MTENNNLSVLPFYTDIKEQNHRRSYAYGEVYPLYTLLRVVPPFQIRRRTRAGGVTRAKLMTKDGNFVADILQYLQQGGLQVCRFEDFDYDIIVSPSNYAIALASLKVGMYYIELTDGTETWYSDIFTMVSSTEPFLSVEWWDNNDLQMRESCIIYNTVKFRNRIFLPVELGKPEYNFEEEGEERDGLFFPEKQISEKVYKFTFLASEYLCDVMRLVRLSDFVRVYDRYGNRYVCDKFLMTPKWQEQGNLASVEVEFETDTVVKKIGTGFINGDYNDDFDNSFDNLDWSRINY